MNALNTLLTQSNTKETPVSLPVQLKAKYPLVQTFARQIAEHRQIIQNILAGKDQRLMVITGPCSIHDPIAVLEYADRLQNYKKSKRSNLHCDACLY